MEQLFDPFVLLFTAGFTFCGIWFLYKVIRWIEGLSPDDRLLLRNGVFRSATWKAIGEVVRESLIHRNIFRKNLRLGYMHMSLALGWFILIVLGNIESTYYSGKLFKPIYVSVFWRFFDPGPAFPRAVLEPGFAFWMDFFLLMVLSGLLLVFLKRFRPGVVGMKRTTRQRAVDRFGLAALWLIFPLRLLAESFTCGANGTGSFLTGSLGYLLSTFLPVQSLVLPSWWAYSFVLAAFFFFLPFTRYAHIPSEAVLIFLRKYGVRVNPDSPGYTDLSLHSCSSCGICIDACQITGAAPSIPVQSSYYVRSARHHELSDVQWDCLLCGRCEKACPVNLELMPLRQLSRPDMGIGSRASHLGLIGRNGSSRRILYFAGCMSHLTPAIPRAMTKIFEASGASWQFFDSDGRACCGRPLKLAGQIQGATNAREKLQADFISSGAGLLVTSCPICYRMFHEDYDLPGIKVLHHTQYILELLEWKRIRIDRNQATASWHEPCELGRGSGITREPRELLALIYHADVTPSMEGLCCGGSLGAPGLDLSTRKAVARGAISQLTVNEPDVLITGCPLCKKTFSAVSPVPVMDIAEATAAALAGSKPSQMVREFRSAPVPPLRVTVNREP